jgi:putative transposase
MGCSIQYESYKNELPFIYHLEHDPAVLEFYDQPEKIKLVYQNKDDTRQVVARHTPDFFVLQEKAAGWVECKMEEDLVRLAKQIPHRYVPNPDGTWSCPPGEAYAKPLGLFYQIRSSRDIDWTVYRNFRFLQQYRRGPCASVLSDTVTAIQDAVMMTRAVLEEARKLGYRVGVVGPTRESRLMYERLGFVLHRQGLPCYSLKP